MFRSVVVASSLAAVVLAQSNPLIPTSISQGCSSFLTGLNTDTSMSSCLQSITSATSAFGPSANSTASSSAASSALAQLCASTACSDATLRAQLASFYAACTSELVSSPNQQVLTQYDALYALAPMKDALCLKQDGAYCVQTLNGASSSSKKRAADDQVVIVPDASAFSSQNIAFLRLTASTPSSTLCSACSKSVLQSWISSMNAAAYAPGLSGSALLGGWPALYNGTLSTCGADFLDTDATNNAGAGGALGSGVLGGAASGASSHRAESTVLGAVSALALAVFAL